MWPTVRVMSQFDGQSGIESHKVTDGRVGPDYHRREDSMVCSASSEDSTAGIDVELYRVPVILVSDKSAIFLGEKLIKPD